MVAIIADVFDKAAAELDQKQTKYSTARESTNSMDESALTVSSHVTTKGHEAATARGGARKLQSKSAPKVISPSGKFSGLSSRGTLEDSAAAGFGKSPSKKGPPQPDLHASVVGQGGGAVGANKDTTGPKEPSTVASLRDATVTSPQAEKTGTTAKSKRDKDWRYKNR
ncbi:hypothetical protein HPB51_025845 [Rhipicephalus microplus]|uniref:Uncharacterized protein n=1 Tax=Rhipicephalus microplus TaxID=6941 RepID=A0A9J6F8T2_RHIMP|nr:hypothetical protein HPB51_025845 [Rhipicephalus microplus]